MDFFSKKNIQCTCGMVINIKKDKMKSIVCPHCKNTVVYDQSKGNKAVCPICKEKLATEDALKNTAEIKCPTCSCELTVDKNATTYTCPLCDTTINVKKILDMEIECIADTHRDAKIDLTGPTAGFKVSFKLGLVLIVCLCPPSSGQLLALEHSNPI